VLAPLRPERVTHQQCDNQQRSLDNVLRVVRKIEHRQTIDQRRHENRPDQSPEGIRLIGAEDCEADQRRRNGL
jgi:hypothetical protein